MVVSTYTHVLLNRMAFTVTPEWEYATEWFLATDMLWQLLSGCGATRPRSRYLRVGGLLTRHPLDLRLRDQGSSWVHPNLLDLSVGRVIPPVAVLTPERRWELTPTGVSVVDGWWVPPGQY